MNPKTRNRRKFARITANIPCEILDPFSSLALGKGFIVDFSFGGMAVASTVKLEHDTETMIKVPHDNTELFLNLLIVNERRIMGDIYIYGARYSGVNFFRRFKVKSILNKLLE